MFMGRLCDIIRIGSGRGAERFERGGEFRYGVDAEGLSETGRGGRSRWDGAWRAPPAVDLADRERKNDFVCPSIEKTVEG